MLNQLELWTKNTPLFETAASGNRVVSATPAWAKDFTKRDHSFATMERQMSALNNNYACQLTEYCIEYVEEWEIVVTTRIKSNIKQAEDLRKDLNHYDKKVKGLRDVETKTTEKGKSPDAKAKEKLKRNQEKLDMARQEFDKYATSVCHIIDSALRLAWMDMMPLVYRLTNMEYDRRGGKDAEAFTKKLSQLVDKLRALAKEFEIDTSMPAQTAKPAPTSATKAVKPLKQSPTKKTATAVEDPKPKESSKDGGAGTSRALSPKRLFGGANGGT